MSEVLMGAAGRDGLASEADTAGRSVAAQAAADGGARDAGDDDWFRSGVSLLPEYGLLKVYGPDAAAFLQAQLTNDVAGLADNEVRLAGYCSVKGRLIASFWVWRDSAQQAFWLACSRDIAAGVAKRLSMFVLRAKLKVEDVSESIALLGIVTVSGGDQTNPPRNSRLAGALSLPPVALASPVVAALDPALVETTADAVIGRALQPIDAAAAEGTLQQLQAEGTTLLSADVWRRLEVLSGVARINALNQDLFVPQMVNFELVGGVSFKKGCYPGQEVVARSQYLGKLKRRMFLGLGTGALPSVGADVAARVAPAAGTDSPAAEKTGEPTGRVVLSAPLADGKRFVVLLESRIAAPAGADEAQSEGWRIGDSDIASLPLPYLTPAPGAPAPRTTSADGA